jgi:hypothetical protein
MEIEEYLIGFDTREMWLDVNDLWPQDRRGDFLVIDDIDKPLSTDTLVWPSVFDIDDQLEVPSWRGTQNLWEDLQRMEDCLNQGWGSMWRPCQIIGITSLGRLSFDERWGVEETTPSQINEAWAFLGYDVSDSRSLLSGLLNFSYSKDQREVLQKRWAHHLNKNHLFVKSDQAIDEANEFRKRMDEATSGHAPFRVYGLYLIRQVGK